jgi:hypothetical protein
MYEKIDLTNLNSGAALDLFGREWEKVLDNIRDENTKPDAVREVTLKIKIKPSKDRSAAATLVQVTSRVAPVEPHEAFVVLDFDGEKVTAFTTPNPKQGELPFSSEEGEKIIPMKGAK